MGRPKLPINAGIVRKLAGRMMSKSEIAAIVGCDRTLIEKRFSQEYAFGRETGKKRLRDKQLQSALRGNVTMLIWLGKQYLGQSDKLQAEVSDGREPAPIESFMRNPMLLERAMQLERDIADASADVAVNPWSPCLPGLEVPEAPPSPRSGGNGTLHKPGQE